MLVYIQENANKRVAKSCEKLRKVAKIFKCESCDYTTCRKSSYDKHLSTRKHKMLINANISILESDKIHFCELCHFECCKKYDFTKHLSTRKQKMLVNTSTTSQKTANNFKCICGNFLFFIYNYFF